MPTAKLAWLFTFASLAMLGCTSLEQGAQEEFTTKFSCPKDRVKVVPRSDLKAFDITFGTRAPPPADVASDPARLAIWQKKQDDTEASWNAGTPVFEVTGCDKDVIFTCGRAQKHASTSSGIMCSEARHVPGATESGGSGSPSGASGGRIPKHSR